MRAANRGMGTSDFGELAGEELATCPVGRLRITSWPWPPLKTRHFADLGRGQQRAGKV